MTWDGQIAWETRPQTATTTKAITERKDHFERLSCSYATRTCLFYSNGLGLRLRESASFRYTFNIPICFIKKGVGALYSGGPFQVKFLDLIEKLATVSGFIYIATLLELVSVMNGLS
jgi:hypothetical protein